MVNLRYLPNNLSWTINFTIANDFKMSQSPISKVNPGWSLEPLCQTWVGGYIEPYWWESSIHVHRIFTIIYPLRICIPMIYRTFWLWHMKKRAYHTHEPPEKIRCYCCLHGEHYGKTSGESQNEFVRIRTYVYESRKTSRANDDPALCLQSSFLFLCLSFLLDSFPPATDGFTMQK